MVGREPGTWFLEFGRQEVKWMTAYIYVLTFNRWEVGDVCMSRTLDGSWEVYSGDADGVGEDGNVSRPSWGVDVRGRGDWIFCGRAESGR
jgi:hypothetical protein